MQMVDVHLPTIDGRLFILSRYTQPDLDQKLLLTQLELILPEQPPPRIATSTAKAHYPPGSSLQCRPFGVELNKIKHLSNPYSAELRKMG